MPIKTKIEWTDFTSNPIRFRDQRSQSVWGCVKTSPGCAHCYAETIGGRWKRGGPFTAATMATLTPRLDMAELWALLRSKPITGRRVFVGDMTDIFGDWVPDAFLDVLLVVMAYRHDVTFQLLTKRAERMQAYFDGVGANTDAWRNRWDVARRVVRDQFSMSLRPHQRAREYVGVAMAFRTFPLPNVHVGVSAEDQPRADERTPLLLQTPAAVRFISAEPLIAAVDLRLDRGFCRACKQFTPGTIEGHCFDPTSPCFSGEMSIGDGIDWIIVGGESGPGARVCGLNWIRSIVQQCHVASVPVFVKQVGRYFAWSEPGVNGGGVSIDRKGGDPAEWSADLRVRQFPEAGR